MPLGAPDLIQGTSPAMSQTMSSSAWASTACPMLIPPGSPCLHLLPRQYCDFSSEQRCYCRLGRVFLQTTLWYCWDKCYNGIPVQWDRVLWWTGSVPMLAWQGDSTRALNISIICSSMEIKLVLPVGLSL